MNDSFRRLKLHCSHMEKINKLEDRCKYHELKFKVILNANDKEKYLKVVISDQRFFSINSNFSRDLFNENITNINYFIDGWILREQIQ